MRLQAGHMDKLQIHQRLWLHLVQPSIPTVIEAAGTYTKNVPTDAGTWYVKATVTGTDNSRAQESSAVEFTIAKAAAR